MTSRHIRDHSRLLAGLVVAVFIAAAAVGCGGTDGDTDSDDAAQTLTSEQGQFEGHFTADPDPPVSGENSVVAQLEVAESADICCSGDPVVDAELDVEPWMPGHGHGSPEEPEVVDDAEGEYVISNIVYNMPGHWELHLEVSAEGQTDEFVVDYEVQ